MKCKQENVWRSDPFTGAFDDVGVLLYACACPCCAYGSMAANAPKGAVPGAGNCCAGCCLAQLTNEINEREEEKEKCEKYGTRLGAPSGPVMRRGLGL